MSNFSEETYSNLNIDNKALYLVGAIQNAEVSEDGRQTAAGLLLLHFNDFFPKLPFEQQKLLREQLLLTIQMDLTQKLRRKVCDVVSELASHLDDGANQWPEFIQFMFTCANTQDSNMKEAGIRIITLVPEVFGKQYQNLDAMKSMLLAALQPNESHALRVQAVEAVGAFILLHGKEPAVQKYLSDLLEPMMRVVVESMEIAKDASALRMVLELADTTPTFLRPHPQLENIFQAAIKMVEDKHRNYSWREVALEVMVTLCETAPAMVEKRVPQAVRALTRLVLEMMCVIDDDPQWAMEDDDYSDTKRLDAESALDRLCCALSGKTMLRLLVGLVPLMLQSRDWERRHAALMAVSSVSKGCYDKIMKNTLDEVGSAVLNHLADPHPRVRYAACNAVMLMSTDFAPIFEEKFHDKVVFGLFLLLDDNANQRVQAHAAAALAKFSKHCPKPILTIYLEPLMNKLEVILTAESKELNQHGRKHVLEEILTTIGSIADTVERDFGPYYDRFMPCLKHIIANTMTGLLKLLCEKAIKCFSFIGLAVGEEKILGDASEVMELLLKTYAEEEQFPVPSDRPTFFFFTAWSRICRIMGMNFAQYLPRVMGPVMEAAMKSSQQKNVFNSLNLASACDMLLCCARDLKVAFEEYAEDVVKLMVPMLTFHHGIRGGVRKAAAESLPCLFECARLRGHQYIEGMWAYILPELLKAIDSEQEEEVQFKLLNSLAKCIDLLGTGCLTDETMDEVLRILNKLLTKHFERAAEHQRQRAHEDYDECMLPGTGYLTDETLGEVLRILNKLVTKHFERIAEHRRQHAHEDYDVVNMLPGEGHTAGSLEAHRVIAVLADALSRSADGPVYPETVAFVTLMQSNAEIFKWCLMHLSDEQKEALQQALSQVA